jgi:acetyl-CoA C-acetyltransferase
VLPPRHQEINLGTVDVIENNEAFTAQACAVSRELNQDPERLNPNGGAIALGHPVGAAGAILVTKLLHELHRIKGRYGPVTMCIGGGQGIAAIFETLQRIIVARARARLSRLQDAPTVGPVCK